MQVNLSNRSDKKWWHGWLSGLFAVLLLVGSPAAQAQNDQPELSETLAMLDTLRDQLQVELDSLDHTLFDLEAVQFETGFMEATEIVGYLQERIRFEQYPGLLRGEEGTLIAGAGNALDQSILLANLLGTAGYDVQIQRGELDRSQAEQLVRQLQPLQTEAPDDLTAEESPLELDQEDLAIIEGRLDSEVERLQTSANAAEDFLLAELMNAGIELGAGPQTDLVQEARDYFWVEYRLGDQDDWSAAHVAFTDPPESLADLQSTQTIEGEVPQELLHLVRLDVYIEQRMGNELETRPVTQTWSAATANIIGHPITFTNVPDGLGRLDVTASYDEIIDATVFFAPLVNNRNSFFDGTQSFDLNGSSTDSFIAEDQAAPLFGTIGGLFGEAAGALAGEENPDEFVTLSAQWLDYTVIAPGGQETVHRRTVFDRIGAVNRQAGVVELSGEVSTDEMVRALTGTQTLVIAAGEYRPEYVLSQVLTGAISRLDLAISLLENEESAELPEADPARFAHLNHLRLYSAAGDMELPSDALAYRHEPALIVMEESWLRDFGRVDIISNAQRVVRTNPDGLPEHAPDLALRAGVWETRLEGIPITNNGWDVLDTFTAFEAAAEHGIEHVTLTADTGTDALDLPAATMAAIEADLADGYAVVTPVSLPAADSMPGWWRVNAVTGETLGRGGDGRGQATTEYMGLSMTQWGMLVSFLTGYSSCLVNSNDWWELACCTVETAAMTGLGVGLGAGLTRALALGPVELFLLMDVSMGAGTLVYGTALDVLPAFCDLVTGGECQLLTEI